MSLKQLTTYMNRIPIDDPKRNEFVRVVVPALKGTMSSYEKSLIWFCPYCQVMASRNNCCSFTSYYSFTRHLSNIHRSRLPLNGSIFSANSAATSNIHRCDICDRNFSRREHLINHLRSQLHLSNESMNDSMLVFNSDQQEQQAFNSSTNCLDQATYSISTQNRIDQPILLTPSSSESCGLTPATNIETITFNLDHKNNINNNFNLDLAGTDPANEVAVNCCTPDDDNDNYILDSWFTKTIIETSTTLQSSAADKPKPKQDLACTDSSSNKTAKCNTTTVDEDDDDDDDDEIRLFNHWITYTKTTTTTTLKNANAFDSSNKNIILKPDDSTSKVSNKEAALCDDTGDHSQSQPITETDSLLSSDRKRRKLDNKNAKPDRNDDAGEDDEALFNTWIIKTIISESNSFLTSSSSLSLSLSSSAKSPKQDRVSVDCSNKSTNDDDDQNDSMLLSNNMSNFEQPSTSKRTYIQAFRPPIKSNLKKLNKKGSNNKRVRFSQ